MLGDWAVVPCKLLRECRSALKRRIPQLAMPTTKFYTLNPQSQILTTKLYPPNSKHQTLNLKSQTLNTKPGFWWLPEIGRNRTNYVWVKSCRILNCSGSRDDGQLRNNPELMSYVIIDYFIIETSDRSCHNQIGQSMSGCEIFES